MTFGACTIKLFTVVIVARVLFAATIHFHPSLILAGKAGAYQSGAFTGLHYNGRLLALPANIRLGWKLLVVANNLAYCDTANIKAV